jgi:hypothetical protein
MNKRLKLSVILLAGVLSLFAGGCGDSDSPFFAYPYYALIEYDLIYDEYVILQTYPYEYEGLTERDRLNLNNLDMNIEYILVEVASYGDWSDLENGTYFQG